MPYVALTDSQRVEHKKKQLKDFVYCQMREKKITQAEIGRKLNMTQPSFFSRLADVNFTYEQLVILFTVLGFKEKDLMYFFTM